MSDEVDFLLGVCRPGIHGEDRVRGIYVTVKDGNFSLALTWCRVSSKMSSKIID